MPRARNLFQRQLFRIAAVYGVHHVFYGRKPAAFGNRVFGLRCQPADLVPHRVGKALQAQQIVFVRFVEKRLDQRQSTAAFLFFRG